jgi:hypothetical protein
MAAYVVGCERPGHPVNYAHEHPYVSALCSEATSAAEHEVCVNVGRMMDAPDFCDCECHDAK